MYCNVCIQMCTPRMATVADSRIPHKILVAIYVCVCAWVFECMYIHVYIYETEWPQRQGARPSTLDGCGVHRNEHLVWNPTVCHRGHSMCAQLYTYIGILIHVLVKHICTYAHMYRNQYFVLYPTARHSGNSVSYMYTFIYIH